ncbi:helix-turn-helix domain-containing protein [Streptococcus infantarius]|uniref:Helix-turn-helix domain-containing protein n=1 Tax=Streptococcus infantarius TaxID=102684 RepID=A0A380KQK8_9STRE|nr:helix-turn-helix domain-containing protein [Streptococcus infantarius]
MTTAEIIKELCEQMNISVSELARRIGQTPQNFNKKFTTRNCNLG